ncbi:hypothetical protein [Legionella fallonii]|uniref:Uncharacterized protein n=1 Tax=Legionella fallonii LLAP-10 TaxID=1212491 RepID=A0A098G585_9GAMM|nr:hypothetical protein [Legionella fallonii]CEG57141.1 protein of unknown function [Legionella fallonii LLAP-10]
MHQFFLASDLPSPSSNDKSKTYQVLTSHGVLIKASDSYHYARTDGLRTCVAFALINPQDSTALLVHFITLKQVKNVKSLVSGFMENTSLCDNGLIMVIAGGREFFQESVDMCDFLVKYSHELSQQTSIKLRLMAPVVAEENETLSVNINLSTGESIITMTPSDIDTGEYRIDPMASVVLTNLIHPERKAECKQSAFMCA